MLALQMGASWSPECSSSDPIGGLRKQQEMTHILGPMSCMWETQKKHMAFLPSLALTFVAIWRASQHVEDLCVSFDNFRQTKPERNFPWGWTSLKLGARNSTQVSQVDTDME